MRHSAYFRGTEVLPLPLALHLDEADVVKGRSRDVYIIRDAARGDRGDVAFDNLELEKRLHFAVRGRLRVKTYKDLRGGLRSVYAAHEPRQIYVTTGITLQWLFSINDRADWIAL